MGYNIVMSENRTADEVKADLYNALSKKGAPTIVSSNNPNLGSGEKHRSNQYIVGGSPFNSEIAPKYPLESNGRLGKHPTK